jgi:hypothetical protein
MADYLSSMNWGPQPNPLVASAPTINQITPWSSNIQSSPFGGTDYMKSLESPGLGGVDFASSGNGMIGGGDSGGWLSSLKGWGKDSGFLGSTENGVTTQGWGGAALGLAQGLGNAWMGMKQYGLAKDQLAQSKKQFELNYGAQQKTTNAALEDRQKARVASNPGAYQSVGDYMKKNGI